MQMILYVASVIDEPAQKGMIAADLIYCIGLQL